MEPLAPDRISVAQLDDLLRRGERVLLLDVRKEPGYQDSATRAAGAVTRHLQASREAFEETLQPPADKPPASKKRG